MEKTHKLTPATHTSRKQDIEVIKLRLEGNSLSNISKATELKPSTVQYILTQHGVKLDSTHKKAKHYKRLFSFEEESCILADRKAGMARGDIAEKYKVGVSYLKALFYRTDRAAADKTQQPDNAVYGINSDIDSAPESIERKAEFIQATYENLLLQKHKKEELGDIKICSICKEEKLRTEFHIRVMSPDGLIPHCKKCHSLKSKDMYTKNREKILKKVTARSTGLKKEKAAYDKAYSKKRRDEDPEYRIARNLRKRLWEALHEQGADKTSSAVRDVGCTGAELRRHIESLWAEGMSWDNYGNEKTDWVIDHKKPLARFNLKDPEQQKLANHFTNLQPLWAIDNLKKWARY
jgi:hypothetical protein